MSTVHIVLTVFAALWVAFSAYSLLRGASWVVDSLRDYGVPRRWWPWLGAAKAAGALGLLVGLAVPAIGVVAAVCLLLYFLGAEITVARAGEYRHLAYPLLYLVPVAAVLAVGAAT
ncbi:MAG TPA: DoxX family protein [Ornithinicoccus sp.]|nr:DoxX family protein [Ornithinicoccus sp.]